MLSNQFILLAIAALVAVAAIDYKTSFFGRLLNSVFPCKQDPNNSLPCFAQYDFYFLALVGIGIVVLIAILALRYIR